MEALVTLLTIPMQFLRMLQMLKSFLENMGAGKLVLNTKDTHTHTRTLMWLTMGMPDII